MVTPDTPPDGDIVQAVLAGREDLYRVLVRRYQDVMFRHAVRMVGDADEAADIVQKALVKGFRKLASCQDPEKVGGWLFRIGANMCKDHLKSRRRQDVSFDDLGVPMVGSGGPGDDLDQAEIRTAIEGALEELTPGVREAFVMKHLEGCSYEGMAERMGVSISALKMRVHRAREELQVRLANLVPAEWTES
ncbi:MAG: RNA polymerase sigma factor [Longimicrobiales bacterium]